MTFAASVGRALGKVQHLGGVNAVPVFVLDAFQGGGVDAFVLGAAGVQLLHQEGGVPFGVGRDVGVEFAHGADQVCQHAQFCIGPGPQFRRGEHGHGIGEDGFEGLSARPLGRREERRLALVAREAGRELGDVAEPVHPSAVVMRRGAPHPERLIEAGGHDAAADGGDGD